MPITRDLAGQRFGHLTAVDHCSRSRKSGRGTVVVWRVTCDCGNEREVASQALTFGRTKTCVQKECPFYRALRSKMKGKNYVSGQQHIYSTYRRKSIDSDREFTLTAVEFFALLDANCFYCDAPPGNLSKRGPRKEDEYWYNGVDRIDSARGYVLGNVRTACWICNRMKNILTDEQFLEHIRKLYHRLAGRPLPLS